jgi:hypothetical protein
MEFVYEQLYPSPQLLELNPGLPRRVEAEAKRGSPDFLCDDLIIVALPTFIRSCGLARFERREKRRTHDRNR